MNTFKSISYKILKETGKPLHYKEITKKALEMGLFTESKTPEATMNALLIVDINSKGKKSKFIKVAPGTFSVNPDFKERLKVIPWDVVVFVLVFIVLTNKFQALGVVDYIAQMFRGVLGGVWSSIYFASFFGGLTSGIINNIPTSISLSSVYHSLTLDAGVVIQKAVAYGLVVGTNIGALLSPVGALATILWLSLIRKKGFKFPLKKFIVYGLLTGVVSIFVASTIIGLELVLFYQ